MLKLNVGYSRKVGEADFGSRGASVNVEVELDAGVIREPDRLRGQIQHLFEVAEASVNEELNSPQANVRRSPNNGTNGNGQNGHRNGVTNGSSNANGSSNGNGSSRLATQSQVRAIHAIANRQRVDLSNLLQNRFRVARPDDLSIRDASHMIDELKGQQTGGA